MTAGFAIAALGFFLGMRHATDADHVIAVSTIVARHGNMRSAAWIGAVWGIGHTLTILVVGGAIILFEWVIPPRVGLSMELSVGLMLVALGVMNILGVWRDGQGNTVAPPEKLDRRLGSVTVYQLLRPLVVGVVHGLAGSAAVALIVLTTIRSPNWAVLYLLIFGLGTIGGMMLITVAISVPFRAGAEASSPWNRRLRIASGLISLAFGIGIAYQIGVVNGLFSGT